MPATPFLTSLARRGVFLGAMIAMLVLLLFALRYTLIAAIALNRLPVAEAMPAIKQAAVYDLAFLIVLVPLLYVRKKAVEREKLIP